MLNFTSLSLKYEFIAQVLNKTDIHFGIIQSCGPSADIVIMHDNKTYMISSGVCIGDVNGTTPSFLNMHPDLFISLLNYAKADFPSFEEKRNI